MDSTQAPPSNAAPSPTPPPRAARRPALLIAALIVAGLLAVIFVAIQFIPVNRTNPAVTAAIQWNSPQTEALARRACLDCHSNETVWPWYSNVAPVSWLVYYDVQQGRSRLNFSNYAAGGQRPPASPTNDLAFTLGRFLAGGGGEEGPGGEGPGRGFNPPNPSQRETFQAAQTPQAGQSPRAGQGQGQGRGQGGQFPGGFGGRENEAAQQIQDGNMPPANYLMLHPSAALSDAEKKLLIDGLTASMGTVAR